MTEAELARNVETLCKYLGVRYYHTWNSRHSVAGFPDYVLITKDGRLLFRELKSARGQLSDQQVVWIKALRSAGQNAGTWRPGDWPEVIQRELLPVQATRGVS